MIDSVDLLLSMLMLTTMNIDSIDLVQDVVVTFFDYYYFFVLLLRLRLHSNNYFPNIHHDYHRIKMYFHLISLNILLIMSMNANRYSYDRINLVQLNSYDQ